MEYSLEELKQKSLQLLEKRLSRQVGLSGAHSKSHLTITANLTQVVGKIYKFSEQELFLVYFAALFHDIVRSPSQDKDLKDEQLSAEQAVELLENFEVTDEEKEAVSYAIINHGSNPSWMENPSTREDSPQSLKEKIRFALYVADKIEQNGVRVIARRSAFVAGERLNLPEGDLQDFGFKAGQDTLLVVALETVLRLTFINPEYIYPEKLHSLVQPLYKIHREFVYSIIKALNLTVEKIAQILITRKNSKNRNLLYGRTTEKIEDTDQLSDLIQSKGEIKNEQIQTISQEIVNASKDAIEYFSSNYRQDIDKLMLNWNPQGDLAKTWHTKMVEYLNGTWLNQIENSI